jgi:threonylcarbamoyladenosine tRNA methylthiotransferase MtaB
MKIFLDTIGCRLNQAEIEKFAVQFRTAGHDLVGTASEADLVIVNTCAVTAEAGSDSRQRIRQAGRTAKTQIIATGCLSTLEGDLLLKIPGVIQNIPNSQKDNLVETILQAKGLPAKGSILERHPIPGRRKRTRAFIKAQDGCDNHCTFCITRLVRGKSRSVPVKEILADIHSAMEGGSKEVVLSGVQLGSWGTDLTPRKNLASLVQTVMKETMIPRLRLSSVEPWDLEDDFFELWKNPCMCRQLHLPLQSGSDKILKLMGRKYSREQYENLVKRAREKCPSIAITTDILVGFPGETEVDHQETLDFIKRIGYSAGHVFTFSPRPGTGADKLPDQIPSFVKKNRSREMRDLFDEKMKKYHQLFLNEKMAVLWEQSEHQIEGDYQLEGWTDNYIRVFARNKINLHNEISQVKLIESRDERMFGEIVG